MCFDLSMESNRIMVEQIRRGIEANKHAEPREVEKTEAERRVVLSEIPAPTKLELV